jgi:hypothetical protein
MTLRPPPSLHEPRIRDYSDERLFTTISEGYGLMPALAATLAPPDRWAVVSYVRALERSQSVPLDALGADERRTLEAKLP